MKDRLSGFEGKVDVIENQMKIKNNEEVETEM
jgi:hypothetical protein